MPSQAEHLQKAEENRDFADGLPSRDAVSVGWSLVAIFYSALHFVEAFNAKYNHHCFDHHEVNDSILRNPQIDAISDDYNDVKNFGWNFRYRTVRYGDTELKEARDSLAAIEAHIRPRL